MIQKFLLFLCLLTTQSAISQGYLGLTRKQVQKGFEKYISKNDYEQSKVVQTDTSIILFIRDSTIKPMDFSCYFGESRVCLKEISIADCDTCLRKNMDTALGKEKYGWKKIGIDSYVSKYGKKIKMHLFKTDKDFRLVAEKVRWNRKEYGDLTAKPQ